MNNPWNYRYFPELIFKCWSSAKTVGKKCEFSRADLFDLHTVEWIKKKKKRGGLGINRGVGFSQLWNRYARLLTAGREISPRSSLFLGKTERATEIEPRKRLSPNFKILTFKLRWIANTFVRENECHTLQENKNIFHVKEFAFHSRLERALW